MAVVTSLLGIPIDCSGRLTGCERAPAAFRDVGLADRLGVTDRGDLPVSLDDPTRDPDTGIVGMAQVTEITNTIRAGVGDLLRGGDKPLIVGGSCMLLIGIAAALRDVYGRAGLAFIDGHIDYYDGATSATGECSDMELAILTGHGPAQLTGLAGEKPLIFPADVTALGVRDLEQARRAGAPHPNPAIRIFEFDAAMTADDLSELGKQTALRFMADPGRFWLHLDLDVLSTGAMPAVDAPQTGGYDWDQLRRLVRPLTSTPGLLGVDVTIYNPALDPDGSAARKAVEFLADVLA